MHEGSAAFSRWLDEDYPPIDGPYQNRTYFESLSPEEVVRAWARTARLIREGRAPDDVGLYVHWPFCPSRCAYCYCDARVPIAGERASHLAALINEMDMFRDALRGTALARVQVYGGTPTCAETEELDGLFQAIRDRFTLKDGAQVAIEATPASLTGEIVEVLARNGVGAVDLGLDSLDERVLACAGRRGQDSAGAERALRCLSGRFDVGVSLLYGLEAQTPSSFINDLGWVVRRRPRRAILYGFDPRPQTAFRRDGKQLSEFRRAEIRTVLSEAGRVLRAAGYRSRPEGWRPPSSLLALGRSAMSHAFGSLWYQHPPAEGRRCDDTKIPAFLGLRSSLQEEMRARVVRSLFARGGVDLFGFRQHCGVSLRDVPALRRPAEALEAKGVLRVEGGSLRYNTWDPARRALARRSFYSPRVVRALRRADTTGGAGADWGAPCLSFARGQTR